MPEQPGLFDAPSPPVPAPARPGRGRARETYARTVVADVTVRDAAALREEALRVLDDDGIVIGESPGMREDPLDPREEAATSAAAALAWRLEPTAGLWPMLDAGAVQMIDVDLAVEEKSAAQVKARWTVTIKIRDAPAARALALAACPATDARARAEIGHSFAAVWRWAADPYTPLMGVPGITWSPVSVTVEQVMSRPARPTAG